MTMLVAVFATFVLAQDTDISVVKSKDIKWADSKTLPKGAKSCVLCGEPDKGASLLMIKAEAGTTWQPHTHSCEEVITVISGTIIIGQGVNVDDTKGVLVEAGSYFKIPAKLAHWGKAKTDVVLQRYGSGPYDMTPCGVYDDAPRKK